MPQQLSILFLCTGNSCRSQMAEGFARAMHPDTIDAYSAGVEPHGLNPLAVRAMREAGVDIAHHRAKHVDELKHIRFDAVVTVCDHANETCPVFPGTTQRLHAGFDDPPKLAANAASVEAAMLHYRRVRDEIRDFVRHLPDRLRNEGGERGRRP